MISVRTCITCTMFTSQLLVFSQAETEVVVNSGNVNVVDKMIVSGYDVKVGQNSICWSVTFIYCSPILQSAYPTHLFPLSQNIILLLFFYIDCFFCILNCVLSAKFFKTNWQRNVPTVQLVFLGIKLPIFFWLLTQGHVLSDGEPIQDVGFLLFSKTVTQKVC